MDNFGIKEEIKAVLFDVDNTLIASNEFVFRNIKKTVERLNGVGHDISMPEDDEIVRVLAKNLPFEEIFQELFTGDDKKTSRLLWEVVLEKYREHAPNEPYKACEGAIEAVDKLGEIGIIVGLVTNRVKMLEDRLKEAGFNTDNFFCMCMPPEKQYKKPHPRAFEEAINLLKEKGVHVDQMVMIGDHPDDYYSAYYQNIPFIAVLSGYTPKEEFVDCGIDESIIFNDLFNIGDVLKKNIKAVFYKKSLERTSALDGRYAAETYSLRHYFSEYALHKYRIKAEIEHLIALSEYFNGQVVRNLNDEEKSRMRALYDNFTANEAYEVLQYDHLKRKGIGPTEHDVKSCELWLREKLGEMVTLKDIVPKVHMFVTSEDINNLAYKSMLAGGVNSVFIPEVLKICKRLRDLALAYTSAPLMARTHMQPASPTTFGKVFSGYLSRLTDGLKRLESVKLKGKINGAVGNYNAFSAAYPDLDWLGYSKELCQKIGFEVDLWTDQRGPHNDMIQAFQAVQEISNVMRDIAADLSIYAAIGTIYFSKVESHVGSSVMPHKINPWFAEVAEGNVKKANYLINALSNEMDVSRLQRDLSDHDYERSYGEAIGYNIIAIKHLQIALGLIRPDVDYAREELKNNPQIVSEAIQTILRKHGHEDAYNILKKEFRGAKPTQELIKSFVDKIEVGDDVKGELYKCINPETYIGLAVSLAKQAVEKYDEYMKGNNSYLSAN